MNREQLTGKIGELVDLLRTDEDRRVTMADIASITEVLITTMERYFGSIDTSIYREFQELSDHISSLRTEIARAQPKEIQADRIPRAGKELDEVVKATEEATNTIMEAAEEIMSAETSDVAAYQESVNDACMRIFEACSFQDITGQRVTKVISTLTFIEERLGAILTAWNPSDEELGSAAAKDAEGDAALLNGPALAGEGIDQAQVDAMLAGTDPVAATPSESAPAAPAAEAAEASPAVPAAKAAVPAMAEAEVEPRPLAAAPAADQPAAEAPAPTGEAGPSHSDETASQADIDALFD